MSPSQILNQFINDNQTQAILALIVLDLILGVIAAFVNKGQSFALSYLANFMRNDVLSKVVPFFILSAGAIVSGGTDIVIPGFDMDVVVHGAFIAIAAALVGSLISSLTDLGFPLPAILGRGKY